MKRSICCIPVLILLLFSCQTYKGTKEGTEVARVGDRVLLKEDLPLLPESSILAGDSLRLMQDYVRKWVKHELLLRKAELNLSEEFKQNVEKQLQETRRSLMIYQYEQQMINQKMDTVVSEEDIQAYYDKNTENFRLRDHLVKALYLKIPNEAPNLSRVKNWYRSESNEDLAQLESYCYQFADKYDDFGENWVEFNQILNMVPLEVSNTDYYLRRNQYIEVSDSAYSYYVHLRDYLLNSNYAPVEYVSDEIKDIILNRRKLSFLQNLENSIYNDGADQGAFIIH